MSSIIHFNTYESLQKYRALAPQAKNAIKHRLAFEYAKKCILLESMKQQKPIYLMTPEESTEFEKLQVEIAGLLAELEKLMRLDNDI